MFYQKPLEGSTSYAAHIIRMDSFPLHRHYEVELIFCLKGRVNAQVNGDNILIFPGEMLYVGSFAPHSYEAQENTTVVLVEFGHALLRDDFLEFASKGRFYKKYQDECEVTAEMKSTALVLENPEKNNRLDLIGHIYKLCGSLLRDLSAGETRERKTELERIAPALRLVGLNYTDNLTIEDACRETSLSPGNFCTIFKNAVGMGFHAYLNARRIENACCLLKQTDLPVEEIASLSGFSDIKTFYRVFRKETGTSPLNFRKNK